MGFEADLLAGLLVRGSPWLRFVTRWRILLREHRLGASGPNGRDSNVVFGFASSAESYDGAGGILTSVGAVFEVGLEVGWMGALPAASFCGALMPDLSSIGTKAAKYATRESRDFVPKS